MEGGKGKEIVDFIAGKAIVRKMTSNQVAPKTEQPEQGEAWKVLRNFQSGPESFREGETLVFLGSDAKTGELTFKCEGGELRKWGLKKGTFDYSKAVFTRKGASPVRMLHERASPSDNFPQ